MNCGHCRVKRRDRIRIWLIIALIVSNILLFASNMIWLWQWCQYDYVTEETTVTVDAEDGIASYIGRDGNVYGNSDSQDDQKEEDQDRVQGDQDEEVRNADH